MRSVFPGVFFLWLSISPAVFAEGPDSAVPAAPPALTLEAAVERAVAQSISLQINAIDLQTAKREADTLWAQFFPSLTIGAGVSYAASPLTEKNAQTSSRDPVTYTLNFRASISLNERILTTLERIKLLYQSRFFSYEQARRQIEIQVSRSFYTLLAQKENISIREEVLNLAELQLEKNRISFENGFISNLVYLQSRLSAETEKLNLNRARTEYNSSLREFLMLLGYDQNAETRLEGTIEAIPFDADPEQLIREYLPKRPDIISQRQKIEQLENTRTQTFLTSRGPSINLSASYDGNYFREFTDNLSGSITVAIPLDGWIPGTVKDQALRSARAEVEKAKLELKNIEDTARTGIRSTSAQLRDSWTGIEISRLRVEIAEQTYELTEEGFRNGTVELLTLEDTRNRMAEARQQLLTDELNYQTMILDLAAALNIDWREFLRSSG
ncbi:MAG: TolC family protein [Spirochaetaceae bacterium]|jgi:outer membrane protein TolC|nr:TolC family protein [Spirochaetaceae bacterium]